MKERSEIEEKYKWDLTKFCVDEEDFYKRLKKMEGFAEKIKSFEGKLSNDETLFQCLELQTEISREMTLVSIYAFLKLSENNADRKANEMNKKQEFTISKLTLASTFIDVEIAKFKNEKLIALQKNEKFKNYKKYFADVLRNKKHTLGKREEILLSKISEFLGGSSESFDKFSDVDLKFGNIKDSKGKEYEFDQSKYRIFAESKDRELRKNVFKELNGKYGEYINFLASNYINNVKEDCVCAKIRKHKSTLKASIFQEEASEYVYNLLIKKVRQNVDIMHDFFEIKRQMLGIDNIAIYDNFAPVSKELNFSFTYEEAIEIIKKATAVLGKEYTDLIDRAKNERWIDVFPNKNKDSGAFATGTVGATPVVLMNFEGNLNSVFTLAHELGHAMHTYFSNLCQPIQLSDYVIFVAEVASTVNEMLLLKYLLEKAKTKEEKIYYYDHFLTEVRTTIFRQTMFAEFEHFSHEEYEKENPLSADLLCEKYEELNNFYYGKKVAQIPEMKYEWARIPHFYRPFYVYKYATGMICAIKISNGLYNDKTFAKKYIQFLSAGCKDDPISLLKIADCDLTKEETFDYAFDVCKDYIKKWKESL